uniref:Interleukin 6 receptor n=1 Tax=Podarcis muralis TaxID=64176 RepID=A0A670JKA3_PODMU
VIRVGCTFATRSVRNPQQCACARAACDSALLHMRKVRFSPGMNVTLPCLEGELENITQVHWMFNGRNLSASTGRQVIPGPSLFLPSVYFSDSGRYACYTDSRRLLCSLRLMVEEPPEAPNFTCFRKSLAKDIFCEWKTSRGMSTHTKARMWGCQGFGLAMGNPVIPIPILSSLFYISTSVCADKVNPDGLLKPDPPVDVEVRNVELHPCKLFVTWRKPPSWGSSFFRLQFEIRYRVEASAAACCMQHTCVRHVVQVRAREEFNQGIWSEWSRESFGVPWTGWQCPFRCPSCALPYMAGLWECCG